jgi:hypothetical protein
MSLTSAVVRIFWRSFLSIAAVFMLVVISAAGYWTWTTAQEWRVERTVSATRQWPPGEISVWVGKDRKERKDALKASVKTRCADSVLYYILTIEKNPAVATDEPFEDLVGRVSDFDIELQDSDGFKVSSVAVARKDTVRVLGKLGKPEKREANASTACEKYSYARVERVQVGWRDE